MTNGFGYLFIASDKYFVPSILITSGDKCFSLRWRSLEWDLWIRLEDRVLNVMTGDDGGDSLLSVLDSSDGRFGLLPFRSLLC